jgi:hypothetical protein
LAAHAALLGEILVTEVVLSRLHRLSALHDRKHRLGAGNTAISICLRAGLDENEARTYNRWWRPSNISNAVNFPMPELTADRLLDPVIHLNPKQETREIKCLILISSCAHARGRFK